ncbi:MAG: SDR family NAD(P)-dependent oxidoreductase [Micromonosporaceae bacterium]|nr:SDR family NAD(P)-dependent oxidoreductase [Micromonosporaceae bacterium]
MTNAIITGGSRGLGLALAGALVADGWRVVIDARTAAELAEAADRLGPAAVAVPGDLTDPAHRAELLAAAAELGGLDLLVNNGGTLGPSPLPPVAALPLPELRELYEVNVVAPVALTQAALPALRTAGGVLVFITSDAAVEPYQGWGGYGSAKAALERLAAGLAAEEPAVTVWTLDPGDLRTRMHQQAFPGEDISDRPLPATVAPGLAAMLAKRPASGRYRLADWQPS